MSTRDDIAKSVVQLAAKGRASSVLLWCFPESEHPQWIIEGLGEVTYLEHLRRLATVRDECEKHGIKVIFVKPSVPEIVKIMHDSGLPNSPNGRAQALCQWYAIQ